MKQNTKLVEMSLCSNNDKNFTANEARNLVRNDFLKKELNLSKEISIPLIGSRENIETIIGLATKIEEGERGAKRCYYDSLNISILYTKQNELYSITIMNPTIMVYEHKVGSNNVFSTNHDYLYFHNIAEEGKKRVSVRGPVYDARDLEDGIIKAGYADYILYGYANQIDDYGTYSVLIDAIVVLPHK